MKKHSIRKRNNLKKRSSKSKKRVYKKSHTKKNLKKRKHVKIRRSVKRGGGCCGGYPLKGGMGPVGYSWDGGKPSTWPGVKGVDGMSNHFPVSRYGVSPGGVDPAVPTNGQKGGFLQDLVNLGRYSQYDGQSVMNGLMGVKQPINPLPYNDQPIDKDVKIMTNTPPDLTKYYIDANNYTGKL